MSFEEDPILTSEEAAEVAGLKPRTIAAWCRSGRIDAGAPPYRIRRSALLSALGTRPGASPSPEAAADAALAHATPSFADGLHREGHRHTPQSNSSPHTRAPQAGTGSSRVVAPGRAAVTRSWRRT